MEIPKPGTSQHQKLLDLVLRRTRASENALTTRHEQWRRSERTYRLYVNPYEIQGPAENITNESEALYTYPTSIVVPLSYAITQTLIAFWTTLFTSHRPYLPITPRDGESASAARAQEFLLTYQLDYIGYTPFLYNWFLDSCRYGVGIVKNGWDVVYRNQTVRRSMDLMGPDGPLKVEIRDKKPVLEYEGNVPEVIDPFSWRPDHRWPVSQFQRGSFCGEALYRSYFELLRQAGRGIYQNVEEIPHKSQEHFKENSSDRDRISQTNSYFGFGYDYVKNTDSLVLVEEITIDLIPSEYEFSTSTEVERWIITMANRAIILRADPFPFDHNDYTYAVMESSPDTHTLLNPGVIEIMEPVHQHITWFINTMLENARKSLNDRLVVDPDIINMDDLLSPSAGKAIRINRKYWGIPGMTQGAVTQLNVQDIAAQNFKHVGFLIDLLQRISAATELIQGQVESEERTATEVSGAAQQGASRLRMLGSLQASMGLTPLARQMVQNNMQLLSQEQYLHMVGPLEQEFQGLGKAVSGNGVMISPEDIQGLFSFPISDASAPLDPVRFARTWVQIMQVSLQNPLMAQQVNHVEIWKEMIRAMGIPDPSRFILPQQVQVMPDQQIQQQVQAGNLQPMNPASRPPIPQQPQPQSIQGEENRPLNPEGR